MTLVEWYGEPEGSSLLRSAGQGLPFALVEIRDAKGKALPVGETYSCCEAELQGYWGSEELAQDRIVDGWVRSGDIGWLYRNGHLYVLDRADDMIVSSGFNIYPAELETVIADHPRMIEVAVFGIPHEKWGETPMAVCRPAGKSDVLEQKVIDLVAQRMGSYLKPTRVAFTTDPLPKTVASKLSCRTLREPFWRGHERCVDGACPRLTGTDKVGHGKNTHGRTPMSKSTIVALALLMGAALPACAEDRPVKIGVLTDLSGPYASYSGKGSVEAARLAIEDYGGKVLGRPVVLVAADHQNKPDIAGAIAREWYDRGGVDVILDVALSSAGLAVQEVSRNARKIVLLSSSGSSLITGGSCSPYSAQWTFDAYALSKGVSETLVKSGGATWFFITGDFAYGHSLETELTGFVTAAGGKVVGSVSHPVGSPDYASFLLRAQSSHADVIALATSGEDLVNAIKQASEFGITGHQQRLAVPLISVPQLHALGTESIQGVVASTAFVWNRTPKTTAWSQRFFKVVGAMPADTQAANYSSLLHYLKAVDAAGTTDGGAVMAKMRALPVSDMFAEHGELRLNGAMVHDMFLVESKSQAEMTAPWDYVKVLRVIPGTEAFRKLSESGCPLVK